MKKILLSALFVGALFTSQASEARVFQCVAKNARGIPFYGHGFLKLMAKQRALRACQTSPWTILPATCHLVSCN